MHHNANNSYTLRAKRILIIGGSAGIGLATAIAAANEGAQVLIASSNAERLQQAKQLVGHDCETLVTDAGSEPALKKLFDQLQPIDHLVYTAGENISLYQLNQTNLQQAKDYFAIRYWGCVTAVKYAVPLIKAGGSITLTSGIASQRPGPGWWLGASICAAMEGFTRGMAAELAPIRVNAIAPGVVQTNLWDSLPVDQRNQMYAATADKLPVKHVATPDEVAQAYLYCMKQTYSTGQVLTVDGGSVLV